MIAADGVVVGDRAAVGGDRLGDAALISSHCSTWEPHRPGRDTVVGRGAVGVDVGEAAADPGGAGTVGGTPSYPATARRAVSITAEWSSSKRSQVIAVSKVSAIDAAGDEGVAEVGRPEERPAPSATRPHLRRRRAPRGRAASGSLAYLRPPRGVPP